jgi:hypothetical protein
MQYSTRSSNECVKYRLDVQFVGYILKISFTSVNTDLQTTFHAKCGSVFMVYLHTKFYMPTSMPPTKKTVA